MSQPDKTKNIDWIDASTGTGAEALRVLAVGSSNAANTNDKVGDLPGTRFVDFAELTTEMMELHRPDVVLSPLMSSGFDCVELAYRLVDSGFGGRYRAFAEDIPRPEMVKREIRRSFPGLDFDVLVVARTPESRAV